MNIFYWIVVGAIILSVLVLYVVEILAKLNDIPNDNVNILIRNWAFGRYFFITFFFGIVSGHLFLGVPFRWFDCNLIISPFDCAIFDVIVIAILNLILLLIGVLFKVSSSRKYQMTLFFLGLLAGHIIWSMKVIS